jgi:hypothetical protein
MTLKFFTQHVLATPGEGLYSEALSNYRKYITEIEEKLPLTVVNLVKSDWYFNARDPRCPKDGWVVKQLISNDYSVKTREKLPSEFELELLGAYHDCLLNFKYKSVLDLAIQGCAGSLVNKDYDPWRIDEFSTDEDDNLIHEICFLSGVVWRIKCTSFEFSVKDIC